MSRLDAPVTATTQNQPADFRLFLQEELLKRIRKNPNYSLRSFARHLKIHHGTLSQILRGQRPLTESTQKKLIQTLGLGPDAVNLFAPPQGTTAAANYAQVSIDAFHSISDWTYDAIIELIRIPGFQPNTQWIATRFGLSVHEVQIAVERLVRLELLEITADNRWIDLSENNTNIVETDFTSVALKNYQKTLLEKSIATVDQVEKSKRDHTSVVLACSSEDLLEVKAKIKTFRRELTAFLQRKGQNPNSVYAIQVSFFPLDDQEIQSGE